LFSTLLWHIGSAGRSNITCITSHLQPRRRARARTTLRSSSVLAPRASALVSVSTYHNSMMPDRLCMSQRLIRPLPHHLFVPTTPAFVRRYVHPHVPLHAAPSSLYRRYAHPCALSFIVCFVVLYNSRYCPVFPCCLSSRSPRPPSEHSHSRDLELALSSLSRDSKYSHTRDLEFVLILSRSSITL